MKWRNNAGETIVSEDSASFQCWRCSFTVSGPPEFVVVVAEEHCVAHGSQREKTSEPHLGLAPTRQLLTELYVRFEVPTPDETARTLIAFLLGDLTGEQLDYRTVDAG